MSPSRSELPSFVSEAGRLRSFTPPFAFSAFFSPEDTLLCVCASEAALDGISVNNPRIAELTTGSGLVGLHMLQLRENARLAALDVDATAVAVAMSNAVRLGVSPRAQITRADLWSSSTLEILQRFEPDLLICNPPYVPEPPDVSLEIEAGAGPDGTAHLVRTLEIASEIDPDALALSWCSLSNPGKIVRLAARAGYTLDALFIVAIADGEYSGSVHEYLRTLPHAWISEERETLKTIAPDGSARFAYLLMAGTFTKTNSATDNADFVQRLCERFAAEGLDAIQSTDGPFPVHAWLLSRWDELDLRIILHGRNGHENPRRR